jgi:hypothetical protein
LLSLPLALAALAGAQGPPATSVPVGTPPAVVAEGGQVVKAPAPNAPTVEECREFGEKLVAAIHAGDRATVDRLYRFAELAERSISDLQLSADFRQGFLEGLLSKGAPQFVAQIVETAQRGGRFTFLRVRTIDGRPRVLVRLVHPREGVNYQEFTLSRFPDGQIATENVYVMMTGEMLSESLRRVVLRAVSEQPGLLDLLTASEQSYIQHFAKIESIVSDLGEGHYQQALASFRELPPALQQEKSFQILGVRAAAGVSQPDYLQALEEFRRDHPGDASVDLLSIDYDVLKRQYDESLGCIERLNQAVGGDPYLGFLRGNVLRTAGRLADAKAELEKTVAQEPTLDAAYWCRINVALGERNHADTLAWLKRIVDACAMKIDFNQMRAAPDYAAFVASPQFAEFDDWYRRR